MGPLSQSNTNLKLIAGLLGLIESLTWIVLSIICIVLHLTSTLEMNVETYMDAVDVLFYTIFIKSDSGSESTFSGQILTPSHFHIYMWVGTVVNVIWIGVSINVMFRNKTSLKIWSFVTWIVCLEDFILVVLLGVDYNACLSSFPNIQAAVCANGILPILIIAAKGFVLWIVNFISAVVLFKISKGLEEPYSEERERPNQLRFENSVNSAYMSQPQVPNINPNRYNRPSYNNGYNYNQPRPSPKQNSPTKRQWNVYSPTPESPETSSRQSWRPPSAVPDHSPNQRPFVLAPPPKRRLQY